MKKIIAIVIGIILAVAAIVLLDGKYKKEVKSLRQQLTHAQQFVPMERDTVIIHDTIREVVTSPVIMAELRELRRQHLMDEETIRDLGLRLKQLDAVQNTTIETKDTARADVVNNYGFFSYEDEWCHLEFSLEDSTFYYNIRDSLESFVYHEYKHHFLWWHWGVKGYWVKLVNYNPKSTVKYNRYIKPRK